MDFYYELVAQLFSSIKVEKTLTYNGKIFKISEIDENWLKSTKFNEQDLINILNKIYIAISLHSLNWIGSVLTREVLSSIIFIRSIIHDAAPINKSLVTITKCEPVVPTTKCELTGVNSGPITEIDKHALITQEFKQLQDQFNELQKRHNELYNELQKKYYEFNELQKRHNKLQEIIF